jgi:hypothetical protein
MYTNFLSILSFSSLLLYILCLIPGRFPPALDILPLNFLKMEIVKFFKQPMYTLPSCTNRLHTCVYIIITMFPIYCVLKSTT